VWMVKNRRKTRMRGRRRRRRIEIQRPTVPS
jgi:hypothetical protein